MGWKQREEVEKMKNISEILESVKTVGIGGHIRPDGDCWFLYGSVSLYPEIFS